MRGGVGEKHTVYHFKTFEMETLKKTLMLSFFQSTGGWVINRQKVGKKLWRSGERKQDLKYSSPRGGGCF